MRFLREGHHTVTGIYRAMAVRVGPTQRTIKPCSRKRGSEGFNGDSKFPLIIVNWLKFSLLQLFSHNTSHLM